MDSLANYGSDGENSDNSEDLKTPEDRPGATRRASDANYDPVQMDMSEDSNNNNSSGDSDSMPSPRSNQRPEAKADGRRPTPEQRRPDNNSTRDETKREKSERSRHNEKSRRGPDDRRSEHRDRRSRDDERRSRDDDRRREKNSSKDDRDHHHRDDRRDRRRDRERRHSRPERKERYREERSSHHKEKERVRSRSRSRSRSKERTTVPYRPMSYREEKGRNKLAQLEKLGIELKTPEGTPVTPAMAQNYYNPLATATQGKYAEQIQKRKLLWANKAKPDDGQPKPTTGTTNTWVGTTFTHDQDGKMSAKFKRLMGIKEDAPAPSGAKPDILKKQEEMFSNMEQQYEVARATTHTQRGVGLGYASGGYQFPR